MNTKYCLICKFLLLFLITFSHFNLKAETTTVLFFNGIQNTASDYQDSIDKLNSLLKESRNHNEKFNFEVSGTWNPIGLKGYNLRVQSVPLLSLADQFMIDVVELNKSKKNEVDYVDSYVNILLPHQSSNTSLSKVQSDSVLNYVDSEIGSFKDAVKASLTKLNEIGNGKVIVIGHSHGNITANYFWAKAVSEFGASVSSKVRIINVANTTLFSPNGLDLTHEGDRALKLLRLKHDTILPTFHDGNGEDFNKHGFLETYTSNNEVYPISSLNQGVDASITNGYTSFDTRLEDLIYTAKYSLDNVIDSSEVSVSAQFSSPVFMGEVPILTGKINSEQAITSLSITTKLPDREEITDGVTHTLLGCPEEVFGDCTGFDENNNGEIDLSFVTFAQHYFQDLGEYPITIHAENSFGKKSSADFTVTVIPKVDSVSVSPNPVDVGETFKLSVSGKKLTEDVKAYVVGGSECSIATPTNEVFVEFDCTANVEGELNYVVYYKEQVTELYKDIVVAGIPSVCTEGQTDTQSCSAIANGTNIQTRSCLANGQWGAFGSCSISCNSGYHLEGATCVADDTSVAGTENFQAQGNTLSTNTTTPETGEIYRSFYGINTETNTEHVLLQDGVQFVSIEGDINLTEAQVTDNARARVALELKLKSESTDELATFFLAFDERVAGVKSRTYFTSSTTPNGDTVGGEIPIVGLHKIPLTKGTAIKYKIELINDGTNFARVWLDDVSTLLPLTFLPTNDFRFYQTHFMTYVKNANVGDFVKGTVDNIVLKYTENGVEKTAEQDFSSLADGRLPSAGDIFNRVEYVQTGTVQVCTPTATEIKSCSIVNGTGVQTRSCAIDGLSWLDYGTCEVQSCDSGYHEENGACVISSTELGFDFSSDPSWITDQSPDYFWNSSNQTYHAITRNERPNYTPNRYAYINTNLDVTKSFSLSWDMKVVNTSGYGIMNFGLIADDLLVGGSTYINLPTITPKGFLGIGIGSNEDSSGYEIVETKINGSGTPQGLSSHRGGSEGFLNIWMEAYISFNASSKEVYMKLSRKASGDIEFENTFVLPDTFSFNESMTRLGVAHDPYGYQPNLIWTLSPDSFQETQIDNIILMQEGIEIVP